MTKILFNLARLTGILALGLVMAYGGLDMAKQAVTGATIDVAAACGGNACTPTPPNPGHMAPPPFVTPTLPNGSGANVVVIAKDWGLGGAFADAPESAVFSERTSSLGAIVDCTGGPCFGAFASLKRQAGAFGASQGPGFQAAITEVDSHDFMQVFVGINSSAPAQ